MVYKDDWVTGSVGHIAEHNMIGKRLNKQVYVTEYGAKGDGVTDDTAAIQAAMNASKNVFFPAGAYKITASLSPQSSSFLIGQGTSSTIIVATGLAGTALYAPSGRSRIDGLTIQAASVTAGSRGITIDDTHYPQRCDWGQIEIQKFEIGFNVYQSTSGGGVYYNNFGDICITGCTTGAYFKTPTGILSGYLNCNTINRLYIGQYTTGLQVDGAHGLQITAFSAEVGEVGIDFKSGIGLMIFSGWLEGNTVSTISIHDTDAKQFIYMGKQDNRGDHVREFPSIDYEYNAERADQFYFLDAENLFVKGLLGGEWYFQHLEAKGNSDFILLSPDGSRWSLTIANDGTPTWTKL